MKKLHFSRRGKLLDTKGKLYRGRRFATVEVSSSQSFENFADAEDDAVRNLEQRAAENSANAYEVVHVAVEYSRQEYDPTPYTATLVALLYKK